MPYFTNIFFKKMNQQQGHRIEKLELVDCFSMPKLDVRTQKVAKADGEHTDFRADEK